MSLSVPVSVSNSPQGIDLPGQEIDFGRVLVFAGRWKDSPILSKAGLAMVEDLTWLAARVEKSGAPEVSDGSAVREMGCHLCRLLAAPKLPPCRSDECALRPLAEVC